MRNAPTKKSLGWFCSQSNSKRYGLKDLFKTDEIRDSVMGCTW